LFVVPAFEILNAVGETKREVVVVAKQPEVNVVQLFVEVPVDNEFIVV